MNNANNMAITNQGALNFLWFSYFDISQEDAINNVEDALNKCIQRAYRDVCRTFHYKFSSDYIEKLGKQKNGEYVEYISLKKEFREDLNNYLSEQINELLKSSQEEFDIWHERTCDQIVGRAKKFSGPDKELFAIKKDISASSDKVFFYGQAQKWLNMTLKYMLIMGLWDRELEEKKEYFHVPVDSYIMKAASAEGINVPYKNKKQEGVLASGMYSEAKSKVWSQWEKEEYVKFQEDLRSRLEILKVYPMEWEFSVWMRSAKEKDIQK